MWKWQATNRRGDRSDELSLKLGILVSPGTVKKYWPSSLGSGPRRISGPRWKNFVGNHANAMIACDFATVVTARFRVLYVFVIMEIGTRRMLHYNVTSHPAALWTVQQFREAIPSDHRYRFLIHDPEDAQAHANSSSRLELEAEIKGRQTQGKVRAAKDRSS